MASQNKSEVVVVTGASAGVGRATVRAFASQGASIGLLARGTDGLEAARREVEEAGGKAIAIATDVSDPKQVEAAAEKVEQTFGPIDIWVNNAMTTVYSPFMNMTDEEFHRVTEVCYYGFVHGTRSALRRMVPRNRGVVVQVGSALAYRAIPLQSAYCGAKHAIKGFTDAVRTELLHEGSEVRLVMVQLPGLNTPQFQLGKNRLPRKPQPVPPIFQPEVAADAIVHSAHHESREFTVGGFNAVVIAGQKLAPAVADRYLAYTAVDGQMTEDAEGAERPNNLWNPVPGDHGAHGRFDDLATSFSPQVMANKNRYRLALAGIAGAALGTVALLACRSNGSESHSNGFSFTSSLGKR
jgi:NAD(P)-dependent dehydrogenase (short-subunit alcohol dehydrogenase family)